MLLPCIQTVLGFLLCIQPVLGQWLQLLPTFTLWLVLLYTAGRADFANSVHCCKAFALAGGRSYSVHPCKRRCKLLVLPLFGGIEPSS